MYSHGETNYLYCHFFFSFLLAVTSVLIWMKLKAEHGSARRMKYFVHNDNDFDDPYDDEENDKD